MSKICRLGACRLNPVGWHGCARYSVLSARYFGNSGGTTDVFIRPEQFAQGVFYKKGVYLDGKRTA